MVRRTEEWESERGVWIRVARVSAMGVEVGGVYKNGAGRGVRFKGREREREREVASAAERKGEEDDDNLRKYPQYNE